MISDSRVLTPYVSARSLCLSGEVFLDANESQAPGEWRRYPERQDVELCEQLAQHYGVAPQRVSSAILISTAVSILTVTAVIAWVAGMVAV